MKYIKRYEYYEKYQVGDYILTTDEYFVDKKPRYGKIIDIEEPDKTNPFTRFYLILLIDNHNLWVADKMIDRKLVDKEISNYETELTTN